MIAQSLTSEGVFSYWDNGVEGVCAAEGEGSLLGDLLQNRQ